MCVRERGRECVCERVFVCVCEREGEGMCVVKAQMASPVPGMVIGELY